MQNTYSVINASAGSGKTYMLVQRLLMICLRFPNQPDDIRNILALTFTNKAANEMKERILFYLGEFVKDNFANNIDLKNILEALQEKCYRVTLEDLHLRFQKVLNYILHHYSRLNIGTIDKFNARLVNSFSYELGWFTMLDNLLHNQQKNSGLMVFIIWMEFICEATTSFVASFFVHFDNTYGKGYAGGLSFIKSIDKRLYDAIPDTDYRKEAYLASDSIVNNVSLPKYANFKFRDKSVGNGGDYMSMRAFEIYYIEAGTKAVLAEITKLRNPSHTVTAASGSTLINEIILQKRIELWGEGCAWTDLK